jgi:uncharacterized protein YggE
LAIFFAAAAFLAVVAFGQVAAPPGRAAEVARQGTPPAQPERLDTTLVYVNGSGTVRVPPDTASVVIGVDIERPTLAEAQSEASTQATAIMGAIEAAGVATADIRTTAFSVRIVRERQRGEEEERGQRGEIKGFQVSNAVAVTVRDLAALGRILDDAIAAGANEVRNISLFLEEPGDVAGQARSLAMEDARSKADGLASAAGMAVSRVVTISETYSPRPAPVEFATANSGGVAIADASGGDIPIAIGSDEIEVEVQVTYELE